MSEIEETIRHITIGQFCNTKEGKISTPEKRAAFNFAYKKQQERIDELKKTMKTQAEIIKRQDDLLTLAQPSFCAYGDYGYYLEKCKEIQELKKELKE